jgi:hypothetical protein
MYHMITDKRHKTAHVAGPEGRPLCRPKAHRKIEFTATLVGRDMHTCGTCAELQLRAQYEAYMKRLEGMTASEQLEDLR